MVQAEGYKRTSVRPKKRDLGLSREKREKGL